MRLLAAIRLILSNKAAGRDAQALQLYQAVENSGTLVFDELMGLAMAANALGRRGDEIRFLTQASGVRGDDSEVYLRLGRTLSALEQFDAGAQAFKRAFQLDDNLVEAQVSCASNLSQLGREADALVVLDAAATKHPRRSEILFERLRIRKDVANIAGVVDDCRALFAMGAGTLEVVGNWVYHELMLGRWSALDQHIGHISQSKLASDDDGGAGALINPYALLFLVDDPKLQLQAARKWCVHKFGTFTKGPVEFKRGTPATDRITLAYLSSDFRQHPVGLMVVGMIENHDRGKFKIVLISTGPDDGSAVRGRLIKAADLFLDVSMLSDENVARDIRSKNIDILIDLNGPTAGARLGIPARRVAPLQITYLGYPGTSGADFFDYAVVDPIIAPQGSDGCFSEKLIRMPNSYQVNDNRRAPATADLTRGHFGLPEAAFVMCSFNQTVKFNPSMFDVWCDILGRVPGSVLWVLDANAEARTNLIMEASKRGVALDRLFFAPLTTPEEHLARYRCADLFLDTYPYNAHTTATDALWMGCPVITLKGDSFAARVASSLLMAVGLPQLISETVEGYADMAVRLAGDRATLDACRHHLETGRDQFPLFDTLGFTRALETVYEKIWAGWCNAEANRAIEVGAMEVRPGERTA